MPIAFESIVPSAGNATDRFVVRRGAGPADHTMQLLSPASVKTLLAITTADVSGFDEAVDDRVAALLVAGSGVTITYNAVANTLTIAASGGGGGAPGGTTGEIQFNNAGAFGGAADAEIEGGQLRLPAISAPTVPAASGVKVYGRAVAGRVFPAMLPERGRQLSLQPALMDTKIALWVATGNNGTDTNVGFVAGSTGTSTAVSWASTNFRTRMRWREWLVTVASTTAVAGFRGSAQQWTVGGGGTNGTPGASGGFLMSMVWSPATGVVSTHRGFAGMRASVAAPTDVNPSTLLNMCGMAYDAADTNIQFMVNDGAGTATKTDLGASFPKPSGDRTKVYQVILYSPPGSTQSVHYTIRDLETGAEASGSATTNLPATSTALNPYAYVSVGGVSSVIGLAVSQVIVETEV